MRQLTYVGGNKVEWWDVPAPTLQDDGDALVQPLAVGGHATLPMSCHCYLNLPWCCLGPQQHGKGEQ